MSDEQGPQDGVAVRVEWFSPERPVNGTVFVKDDGGNSGGNK